MSLDKVIRFCLYSSFLLAIYSVRLFISPIWLLFISLCLIYSLMIQYRLASPLPSLFLNILSILGIILSLLFSHSEIISLFIYPLIILGIIKFLGDIKPRDIWQVYLISFFILCGAATCNFDLEFGVILIVFTMISIIGLVCLNAKRGPYRLGPSGERRLLFFSLIWSASIVISASIFFLFLPRSPFSLFSGLSFTPSAKTGFTEKISLEEVKDILESTDVAFRVLVKKPFAFRPYWRGIVYEKYSKGAWYVSSLPKERRIDTFSLRKLGGIKQVFYLEPYDGSSLFTLEYPCRLTIRAKCHHVIKVWENLSFSLTNPISRRIRYEVYSDPTPYLPQKSLANRDIYLKVPRDIKKRLSELAKSLVGDIDNNLEAAKIINQYLHSKPFQYSLHVPKIDRLDPILQFLFHTHRGWCEHFASAFVLLLRSIDIPARVVGGYVGGQWNALGHYYLVRQSDAHTWAEVWQDGKGWVRFDPTPILHKSYSHFFISRFLDYIRLRWYAYIINYDFTLQRKIIHKLTRYTFHPKWRINLPKTKFRLSLKGIITVIGLCLLLFFIYRHYTPLNYYQRLKRTLAAHGLEIGPHQTGMELARLASERDPRMGQLVMKFIKTWYEVRYGGAAMDRERKEYLKRILGQIKDIKR